MKRRAWAILTLVLLAWAASARGQDALETVERKLAKKAAEVNSIITNISIVTDVTFEGGSSKSESTGTLEYLKKGDRFLSRMELKTVATQTFGTQTNKTESSTLSVVDGGTAYTLTEQMGRKMAMKHKVDNAQSMDPVAMFENLRDEHELKLLPDSTIDGDPVYVVQARPRSATAGTGRITMYLSKDSGVVRRIVNLNQLRQPVSTINYTEVKVNPKIDHDRFVFKVPDGVEVMDATNR